MIQLPPDFKEFLQLLHSFEIEYLVVGGYAVNYYGFARATADLDLWMASRPDNARRLTKALQAFGFDSASPEMFLEPGKVVRLGVPPIRLELLTSISGCEFDPCYGRRQQVEIDGVEVSLIALDDLKQNKRATGRLRDQVDLQELP